MKKYKRFFNEKHYSPRQISYALSKAIDEFNSNHNYDDWYVSGGCYSFAVSIMNVLKHLKQKYTPWMMGDGIMSLLNLIILFGI